MEKRIIKAYRIEELKTNVKNSVINRYHNEHYWDWDVYANERNKSFMAICDLLGFQLFDDDGGYGVGVKTFDADEIKGASRVIAYVVNRFPMKKAMWSVDEKKTEFYNFRDNPKLGDGNSFHKSINAVTSFIFQR